ncbi:MAG: hypothetical protein CME71_05460 [Halobacteriovorax sp.]|nr:hypothetical protein [Halobacteriovorax sp.]|tara:strand:- start:740 stop:1414 length:675 start_codon:yes stop_codon:yes gene_type:complete
MQTQLGDQNKNSRPITMPEVDEFEFKAIGEGLGFHQPTERPRWKSATVTTKNQPQEKANPHAITREQLGVMYQEATTHIKPKAQAKASVSQTYKNATLPERFTAQVVDTLIITASVATILLAMMSLAQVPLNDSIRLLTSFDVAPVALILWLFSYVSYFTILETKQTPGKNLMRIKVADMNGQRLSLSRSLERTIFRTLSWLALGFPLLMNFHGRLSRSQVLKV